MKSVIRKNAFTIVELIVAMGLLVMLVGLSSVVFSTTVKAHRKATATIEITRNLRVLTEQLNADFRGLRKDAPMAFLFEVHPIDSDGDTVDDKFPCYDQFLFFADGDFQAMGTFPGQVIFGNVARIYYGHANSSNGATDYTDHSVLSRRAHVLTSDLSLTVFPPYDPADDFAAFQAGFTSISNDAVEYDTLTLTEWKNIAAYDADMTTGIDPVNAEQLLAVTMTAAGRPVVDFLSQWTYHLLMSQGVMDFKVQFSEFDPLLQQWRWFPSEDPNGDGDLTDSDFTAIGKTAFGIYFNMPNNLQFDMDGDALNDWSLETAIPKALKFTFRLKDSNNMFPDGKLFTHIVYLDN